MFAETLETLVDMPDTALDEHLRALEIRRRQLDVETAATIAVINNRRIYTDDGHRSINGYLKATCNHSVGEASQWRKLSKLVDTHPVVGEAWMTGRIGRCQARELTRAHTNRTSRERLGEFLPILLTHAETRSHSDLVASVTRFIDGADPDGNHHEHDTNVANRNATIGDIDGALDLHATGGDPLTTAEMIATITHFEAAEFDKDVAARGTQHGDAADQHPLARTAGQRRYDALVAMARRARGATTDGPAVEIVVTVLIGDYTYARMLHQSGLAPATNLSGEPVDPFTGLINPHELLDDMLGDPAELDDRVCETTTGVQLHPHHVLQAALAGHIRRVVVDANSVVIDLGRKQRLLTGSARTAAMLLTTHCEHPGCDLPAEWCHVDHNTEWVDGGTTDQHNANIRCGGHNRHKHRTRIRRRTATNGNDYTIRADGTIILPAGARAPTLQPDNIDDHIRQRTRSLTTDRSP